MTADDRFSGLSPDKRALLEERLKGRGGTRDSDAIPARRPGGPLPLSFAQQRLWFLHQLDPGSTEYNISQDLRVRGSLDVEALERALSEMVARHESLRTTFVTVEGEPFQVVHAPTSVTVDVTELDHLDRDKREVEARRIAATEAARPFDLERGPLLQTCALRLGSDDHVLVLAMHHIVSDGWSAAVFARELTALYDAHLTGDPVRLPELPIQYADFAAWQRRWLAGDVLERQLDYWRERLAGLGPVLELPTDRPRPAVRSGRGRRLAFAIAPGTIAALKRVGRAHDATLFMILAAAFQALLSRYSGSDDIAIGTPIAGRTRADIERLIGFFVNTLVLRTDLSGTPASASSWALPSGKSAVELSRFTKGRQLRRFSRKGGEDIDQAEDPRSRHGSGIRRRSILGGAGAGVPQRPVRRGLRSKHRERRVRLPAVAAPPARSPRRHRRARRSSCTEVHAEIG